MLCGEYLGLTGKEVVVVADVFVDIGIDQEAVRNPDVTVGNYDIFMLGVGERMTTVKSEIDLSLLNCHGLGHRLQEMGQQSFAILHAA